MPSPAPVTGLLPTDFYSSYLRFGACSSPLVKYTKHSTLKVPSLQFHGRVATRLWSSVIHWKELKAMLPIGSGGFGSVYKAVYFRETVAVKKVNKCAKNRLASRQSFWAELNAAHLRHKNIVSILAATTCVPEDLENEDSIGTIVMEYAGSRNLHYVIYGCTDTLEMDRWINYAVDIAHGLGFLHSNGIVHLDLKPANVLISNADVCKIVDFGCSVKLDYGCDPIKLTPNFSNVCGTYTHRAPELLKGEDISPKADIFSYGITLWQLITREQPYMGDRHHVLYAVVAYNLRPSVKDKPLFKTLQGDICRSLVCQCWSAEANLRPSAQEVLILLDKVRVKCSV